MSEPYLSQEKFDELTEELQRRKTTTRREIASQLEHAKQLGDLSENFEYHDAKDRQAENEKRIMELDGLLKTAAIVEASSGGDEIAVGVTFVAEKDGKEITFQIVGSNEANPLDGRISNESPIGSAFLGKRASDVVTVDTPSGAVQYTVKRIQ